MANKMTKIKYFKKNLQIQQCENTTVFKRLGTKVYSMPIYQGFSLQNLHQIFNSL